MRHGPGTKGFLKAVGPTMGKLANWLVKRGFWSAKDYAWYRELVGDDPGAARHEIEPADDLPDEDYLDDSFTIGKVEPGRIHLEALLEGEDDIVLTLPKSVAVKARAGWSVTLELARLRGKWRILGVGNVYP